MVSFEIFVKAMPPSLSELKVLPSFCFAFKIPDDVAASTMQHTVPNSKIVLSLLTKTIIELGEMKWKENHMKENSL